MEEKNPFKITEAELIKIDGAIIMDMQLAKKKGVPYDKDAYLAAQMKINELDSTFRAKYG